MTTHCFIPVRGKRIRVTTLDECGNYPAPGTAASQIVTDGFISVNLSSEVEEGTEIITRKADGTLCVNEKAANSFKRFTVEMEFCGVNPSLLDFTTNAEGYEAYGGDIAGITVAEGTIAKQFALELWTGLSGQACVPGQDSASGYILLPFVQAGVLGNLTIDGENAVSFSLTGAYTKGGNAWGTGPYDVLLGGTGAANEVQTVGTTGVPTGGTFKLYWPGVGTTGVIQYNSAAAAIQTAILALPGVESGDVVASGGPLPTAVTLTFGGGYANMNVPQLLPTEIALTGGTNPTATTATTTQGTPGGAAVLPTALDPLDHLLLVETSIAPPAGACSPSAMPS